MRFFIHSHPGHARTDEFAARLAGLITDAGAEVVDTAAGSDMVVSVGGDGTMLAAAHIALEADVPVVGFNLGTMGFLAHAEPEDAGSTVRRLIDGAYTIEERMTVRAALDGRERHAVNDVVVEKVDTTRLVVLRVTVDGDPFVTYRADGLIVASPTGSTAYSFSAGGPLVDPRLRALVMTPVAAHSLVSRALVLPDGAEVAVEVAADRTVRVNVDKDVLGHLREGERLIVSAGEPRLKFVSLRTFPEAVRDKFGLR
jgi:NAD+ kinase